MKKLIILLLVAGAGTTFADTPEDAFNDLLDSAYEQNADAFLNCLSVESVQMVDMLVYMVKLQPGEAVSRISRELDVEITEDELKEMASIDLINMVLSAPGFQEQLPPRADITFTGAETSGDSSFISFTIVDFPQPLRLLMVKNGENWKLDQSVLQAEL